MLHDCEDNLGLMMVDEWLLKLNNAGIMERQKHTTDWCPKALSLFIARVAGSFMPEASILCRRISGIAPAIGKLRDITVG